MEPKLRGGELYNPTGKIGINNKYYKLTDLIYKY